MSASNSVNPASPSQVVCECDPPQPAKLRVCWKPDNPARRFYNCRYSMYTNRPRCRFFDWVDPEVSEHYKNTLWNLHSSGNAASVEAAQRNLAIAEANMRRMTEELGQLTAAKAKEKEKAAVAIAVLKKDIEALQTRGKVYWYLILCLVVVVLFLVLLK